MLRPVGETHAGQRLYRQLPPVNGIDALIDQRQLHVFQHRQVLDQVVLLENKPDLLVADAGELLVGKLPNVHAVQTVSAPGGDVQTAQQRSS